MSRKNRISVPDGVYHVTTRIANRAMLLGPDEVKTKLQGWILSVADFSGVEVWSFTIMDNHLHLIVHVPPVPEKYWLDPKSEPAAYAFGMRPLECRAPLWRGDSPASSGDSPSSRPPIGFRLDDEEMLNRLGFLYGKRRSGEIAREWRLHRAQGRGELVEREKERYCRRMYNLSQYLKTLKERASMWYNETYGHEGALWQGRFYSGVVDRRHQVLAIVAAYVAYNPVKAKIATSPSGWRWSSYALAAKDVGATGARCRQMYERMFARPWEEVRATLESVFADELPPGVTSEDIREWFDDYDEFSQGGKAEGEYPPRTYRASQAIRVSMKMFRTGAYLTEDYGFLERIRKLLPAHFPREGRRSVRRCRAFVWTLPGQLAA